MSPSPITWTVEGLIARDVAAALGPPCPHCQPHTPPWGRAGPPHHGICSQVSASSSVLVCVWRCDTCQHYATNEEAQRAFQLYHPDVLTELPPRLTIGGARGIGKSKSYWLQRMVELQNGTFKYRCC